MPSDQVKNEFIEKSTTGDLNESKRTQEPLTEATTAPRAKRAGLLSIETRKPVEVKKSAQKESLESILSSALRSDDAELDEILSALEEIADSVRAGTTHPPEVEQALHRAASCALKQSLLDREIRSLAITDELTGLFNRRGFLAAA